MDLQSYVKVLQMLPQEFDEVIRDEDGYRLERSFNGSYFLHRWTDRCGFFGDRIYNCVGCAARSWNQWSAQVDKPYDEATDSDSREIYHGDDEQAAATALWEARHEAA